MRQNKPTVLALLATHNSGKRLLKTLATLKDQTYPNFQVLISDDASTDDTLSMCENAAASDQCFRVIKQSAQLGWVGNINALLKEAKGDYFFFMPHDDELKPTYVEKLAAALDDNPDAVLAYSDIDCFVNDEHNEIQVYKELDGERNHLRRARTWLDYSTSCWCVPYRGLFRADAVTHVKGLRKNLAGEFGADWAWLMHMALTGDFIRVPEVLYQRNRGNHSLSETWKYRKREWLSATLACGSEVWRSTISFGEKCSLQLYVFSACVNIIRDKR